MQIHANGHELDIKPTINKQLTITQAIEITELFGLIKDLTGNIRKS